MASPPTIPEGLEHLMGAFVAEMDKDCRRLLDIRSGDRMLLAEHAHTMRGKAAMFGDNILFELLTAIEEETVSGRSVADDLFDNVVERCEQLALYLRPDRSP